MRLNVGIDVSKETLDLCLLLNQAKSGSKFKCFKNRKVDYLAINDWILKLSKCQPDDAKIRNIKALTRRLSALEKDRLRENNRLEASEISDAHDRVLLSITRIIRIIEEEIQEIENEIDIIISACPTMKKNHDLLMSVIGIGKTSINFTQLQP